MADETELKKALETAIGRISALEGELRSKPKERAEKQAPAFDLVKFREALSLDPIGTMAAIQMTPQHIDYVRQVLEVARMGDQAPPHLRMAVMQGPQMMAAHAANETVATLSRRLDDMDSSARKSAKRESFKSISANKDKYPNLARAVAADPDLERLLDEHKGTAEEFATEQEGKLAKLVAALVPAPAASVNADNKDQSTQVKPAPLAGSLNGDPPPIMRDKPGTWNKEAFTKLRDSIVQKVSLPK